MTPKLTVVVLGAVTLVALVGAIVLTALGYSVPELLPYVVTSGVAGIAGVSLPRSAGNGASGNDDPGTGGPASGYRGPTALHRTDTGARLHPRKSA